LKINNEVTNDAFLLRFKAIFQDFFATIFAFNEEYLIKLKTKLKIVIKTYKDFDEYESDFLKDLETNSFRNLIQTLFKLCVYMLLHDPVLSLNIQGYENRTITYHYFNKNEFVNIEGFANDKSSCAVIITPPILRKNFYYQGLKPAVYIVADPSETILKECERNMAMLNNRRSNSIADPAVCSLKVSKKMEVGSNVISINNGSPKGNKSCIDEVPKGDKKNKAISTLSLSEKKPDKKVAANSTTILPTNSNKGIMFY